MNATQPIPPSKWPTDQTMRNLCFALDTSWTEDQRTTVRKVLVEFDPCRQSSMR